MLRTFFQKEKNRYIVYIVLCLLGIIPLLILGVYDRPSADDYSFSILTHQIYANGGNVFDILSAAFQVSINYYKEWQGAYTCSFINSLQPGIFGEKMYFLTPILIISVCFICLLASINILNRRYLKKSFLFSLASALIVITFIFAWMPSITEGLYWYVGAFCYTPWAFIQLLNYCMCLELTDTPNKKKRIVFIIITIIISFIISGSNLLAMLSNVIFMIFLFINLIYSGKKPYTIFPLLSSIIWSIINYIAPGYRIRMTYFTQKSVIDTMIYSVLQLRDEMGWWCSHIWAIGLIIITPVAIEFAKKNTTKNKVIFPIFPLLISFTIMCAMICAPYYAMGNPGGGRVHNMLWITFVFLSWFNYFALVRWVRYILVKTDFSIKINKEVSNFIKVVSFCICFVLLVFLSQHSNSSYIYRSYSELIYGNAKYYCEEIDKRWEILHNPNIHNVELEELTNKSTMLLFDDITSDITSFQNSKMSRYYNKDSIVAVEYIESWH